MQSMLSCRFNTCLKELDYLRHEKAVHIDLGEAIVSSSPGDGEVMPDGVPLDHAGSLLAIEGCIATLPVWIRPEVDVFKVVAGQDIPQVKDDKVIEVRSPLMLICAMGVQRIGHQGRCSKA